MPSPTKVKTVAIKGSVAVPTPAPAYMPEQADDNSVDQLTTASVPAAKAAATPAPVTEKGPSGWVVQIGVSSSKDAAMDLLQNAKTKGGKALSSAKPFAVAYANDGEQIYRARFGGFEDQRDAVNACKALKRAGVKCWAAAQ
jgi:D-alanyl-D-alanine carboxypeptidase